MKKFILTSFIVIMAMMVAGCLSTNKANKTAEKKGSEEFNVVSVEFDKIVGKDLIGEGDSIGIIYRFLDNGIFEIEKDGNSYSGTWEKNEEMFIYPYSIEWTENGDKNGYIISINEINGQLTIYGHWFITDSYIILTETFKKPY